MEHLLGQLLFLWCYCIIFGTQNADNAIDIQLPKINTKSNHYKTDLTTTDCDLIAEINRSLSVNKNCTSVTTD